MQTCYAMCQGGIKVSDGSNVANQLTWKWEDYPKLSSLAHCTHIGSYK